MPRQRAITRYHIRLVKFRRIFNLQQDLRDGMSWTEVQLKYAISRPAVSRWKKKEIPEDILLKLTDPEGARRQEKKNQDAKALTEIPPDLNIIEFVEGENGLNFKLNLSQRIILKAFYSLTFNPEEEAVMDGWRQSGKTTWKPGQKYIELVVVGGMKGGKTTLASCICCYEEYVLFRTGNPAAHWGLAPGEEIFIINVATSGDQAKDTIFAKTKARLLHSPYYQRRQFDIWQKEIEFPNGVKMRSGHANSSSIVGKTTKLALTDELARFISNKTGKSSGHQVYTALSKSVAPFNTKGRMDGKIVSISSPISETDKIMILFEQSKKIDTMLGFQLATWEMNPDLPFDCPFLQSELKKSPEDFWRDYGAQPSKATEKYYRDRVRIEKAIKRGLSYGLTDPVTADGILVDPFKGKEDVPYYIHLDPSVNNCSFGVAMGHSEGRRILIDLCYRFIAPPNQEIDYNRVGEFLDTLLDRFEVAGLTYDVFMTVEMMQRLRSKYEVEPKFLRVEKRQHDNLKIVAIYGGRLYLYPNPVLRTELRELDLINGKKVDHPVHFADGMPGTNDMADAVAGVVSQITTKEEYEGEGAVMIDPSEILDEQRKEGGTPLKEQSDDPAAGGSVIGDRGFLHIGSGRLGSGSNRLASRFGGSNNIGSRSSVWSKKRVS